MRALAPEEYPVLGASEAPAFESTDPALTWIRINLDISPPVLLPPLGRRIVVNWLVRPIARRPQPCRRKSILLLQIVHHLIGPGMGKLNVIRARTSRVRLALNVDNLVLTRIVPASSSTMAQRIHAHPIVSQGNEVYF